MNQYIGKYSSLITKYGRGLTEKNLMTNKIIDSMDIVNIIAALENKYDISIEFDMITAENFDSIETINAMIRKLQAS